MQSDVAGGSLQHSAVLTMFAGLRRAITGGRAALRRGRLAIVKCLLR